MSLTRAHLRPVHATLRDSNPGTTRRKSLTRGFAPIAAQPCQWPHPPIAQPGNAHNNAATRRYAPSYAAYEGAYVELVGAYSNLPDHVERLRALLDLPQAARPSRLERLPKQAQRRLHPDEVRQLVAAHVAGAGVKKLADRFAIHRQTVRQILQRHGVHRVCGIQPEDLTEAIRLYEDGWPLARLAARFDVSASTVTNTFRRVGVTIRRPRRRPADS